MISEYNDIKKIRDELKFYYGTSENENNLKLEVDGDGFMMTELEDTDIEMAYMAAKRAENIK